MSCKIRWNRKFLVDNFEKNFINKEYKVYRENILFEREVSMLQATQPYVEKQIRLEQLTKEMRELTAKYIEQLNFLQEEYIKTKHSDEKNNKKKFIRKCPNTKCLGFLSTSLKCNLCGCKACSECREIKENDHKCDPEIVESVKLLKKDSKECPKCSSLIYKIDGCNQMFCTECHTAFDWKTLKIENGVIHNPHYFEYLRKTNNGIVPTNPLDIQCGRELNNIFVSDLTYIFRNNLGMKDFTFSNTKIFGKIDDYHSDNGKMIQILNICRQIIHIKHVEQPRFTVPDMLNDNLKERMDFMRKKINEKNFKILLQKKEKNIQKSKDIYEILDMFVISMTDIFYRLIENPNKFLTFFDEMHNLRIYTNECFNTLAKTYNCKKYNITQMFIFI